MAFLDVLIHIHICFYRHFVHLFASPAASPSSWNAVIATSRARGPRGARLRQRFFRQELGMYRFCFGFLKGKHVYNYNILLWFFWKNGVHIYLFLHHLFVFFLLSLFFVGSVKRWPTKPSSVESWKGFFYGCVWMLPLFLDVFLVFFDVFLVFFF